MQIIENTLEITVAEGTISSAAKDEKGSFGFMRCITSLRKESIKYWGIECWHQNRGEDEDTDSKD